MTENFIAEILKEKKLRITNVRSEVLEIFERKNYALSYNDLHEELKNKFDMATIYRTLNTFWKIILFIKSRLTLKHHIML